MKRKLIVFMAALALLAFAVGCELEPSEEENMEVAINFVAKAYPEANVPWQLCAINLYSQTVTTQTDVEMFNEDSEYKMFIMTTIEETCDSAVAQSAS